MRIAVDAMGGDNAPQVVVEGAAQAARELNIEVMLVGDREQVEAALPSWAAEHAHLIRIEHAPDVVTMDEPGYSAAKRRDSSIARAVQLVKDGEAQAMVSAGNSAATVAAATIILGRVEGTERPGIATFYPTKRGTTVVCIDVGATVDCAPAQLVAFAIMGRSYAHKVLGIANPRVGLLNIGEEPHKGTDTIRQAYSLLEKANINFVGNVEGNHAFSGEVDVIVCDGFVGNVVLKCAEGMSELVQSLIRRHMQSSLLYKLSGVLLKPLLKSVARSILYDEYGGAPLLGVNGACVISHGRSNAKAIANAVRIAAETAKHGVVQDVASSLSAWVASSKPGDT